VQLIAERDRLNKDLEQKVYFEMEVNLCSIRMSRTLKRVLLRKIVFRRSQSSSCV
jgi:hypothetical protein